MDLKDISELLSVLGLIGLGIWTITSSLERSQKESSGEQVNQFFTLLLFRGIVFGIIYGIVISLLDSSKYYFLAIPSLVIGGLYINYLGKKS
jgi:uncharacterized protein with PQ loop repeat